MGNGKRKSYKTGAWLPNEVLQSQAYKDLTSGAKNVLVAIAAQYRSDNNGDLSVAVTILSLYGITSPDTISRAVMQLRKHRLIRLTRQGMKFRNRPSLYAITWKPIDKCGGKIGRLAGNVAKNDWRDYAGYPLPLEGYDQ